MSSASSASLLGMWVLMMAAMMLPSLAPALWRYRVAVVRLGRSAPAALTLTMAAGYFLAWAVFASAIYPLAAPLSTLAHRAPIVIGSIVAIAGVLQLSPWKARLLESCRGDAAHACAVPRDAASALRSGVRHGILCCGCCAGFTAVLLLLGDMSLRAMLLATAAITAERLSPGRGAARIFGVAALCAGVFLIVRDV